MRARLINALDPRSSLQARLTLAIAGISVLLSVLVSLLVGMTAERQARQDVGALHAEYAQRLADELDASIDSHDAGDGGRYDRAGPGRRRRASRRAGAPSQT